jgi:selenide,water dikinase
MENGNNFKTPKLTSLSHSSGCGCKIAPLELEQILQNISPYFNQNISIDHRTGDDAAVYNLNDELALVMTTDFFTPIVDDPYLFGKIAATNAINDVFAMGAKPFAALSILGWPVEQLGTKRANDVLKGANDVCLAHHIALVGGHSIDSKEPFFGLSVNGSAAQKQIVRNNGAKANDLLYLTKPIGTGMLSSALKKNLLNQQEIEKLVNALTNVNHIGYVLAKSGLINAMTDVTGFGLLGHMIEMCNDGIGLEIDFNMIPLIDVEKMKTLSAALHVPNNTMRNFKGFYNKCSKLSAFQLHILCDPQTSGGLLLAVEPHNQTAFEQICLDQGVAAHKIGRFKATRIDELAVTLN